MTSFKSPRHPAKVAFLATITFIAVYAGALFFLNKTINWLLVSGEAIMFFIIYYIAQWYLNERRRKSRKKRKKK